MKKWDESVILDATEASIDRAAEALCRGELVAFPTETVYGLGGDATSQRAVSRIYEVKGRPSHNPLISHVFSVEHAKSIVGGWSDEADALADRFWPGPLSLILPKGERIAPSVTGGGTSMAVRMPAHDVALRLIEKSGLPIAAPSANPYTQVSPTTAVDVARKLGDAVSYVIDGGECRVGIESTVISLVGEPTILRLGRIRPHELEEVLGCRVQVATRHQQKGEEPMLSPGLALKHYSPLMPVRVMSVADVIDFYEDSGGASDGAGVTKSLVVTCHSLLPKRSLLWDEVVLGETPEAWEEQLYHVFHDAERGRYGDIARIFVVLPECSESGDEWLAIKDRLMRAATRAGGEK